MKLEAKYLKYPLLLALITFLSSSLFWLIFYFNIPQAIGFPSVSLETVYSNYDGPNYMVISRCNYDKDCIAQNFSLPQPLEYYPAHFPGYPFLISFFDLFTAGPKAMLLATLSGSILLSLSFYYLLKLYLNSKKSFLISLILIFFPARLFVLRQVGAPETWFLSTIILSILTFKSKKYFLSAVFLCLAQTLKTPAVLLLLSYFILALLEYKKHKNIASSIKKYSPYLLVPATIFLIFIYYKLTTGNFLAYFQSGDNFHLNPLPYLVFISTKSWLGTIWLEEIIYIYLLAFLGCYRLFKKLKYDIISIFPTIYTLATVFVAHRDISRYIAPIYPFMLLAYSRFLTKKPLLTILFIIIPAVLLYAINFIIGNTAPISDWTPYL